MTFGFMCSCCAKDILEAELDSGEAMSLPDGRILCTECFADTAVEDAIEDENED